jgi:type III secretion protein Q
LDELPVRLSFELGQLELPLAEVSVLGPGHVFELARDESQPVDILANGRRIGRGRIVTVAGSIGVQIVRVGRG